MRLSPLAPFFYDAAAGRDAVPGKLLAVEIWGLGNGSQRVVGLGHGFLISLLSFPFLSFPFGINCWPKSLLYDDDAWISMHWPVTRLQSCISAPP